MNSRLKNSNRPNLSLPNDRILTTEIIDKCFRIHQESPPIEDDTVYSFANNPMVSSSQQYDGYSSEFRVSDDNGLKDVNDGYPIFQANQQQSQFLAVQGQLGYDVFQKVNMQASPSFSKEVFQGIDSQPLPSFKAEKESLKKQIVSNSVQKQSMSPSWTSPSSNGQKLFIDSLPNEIDSRKDSINSNRQCYPSHPNDINDSFAKNSDNYQAKGNTHRSGNSEEASEYTKAKYVTPNTKTTSTTTKQAPQSTSIVNEINCLVLEEATQEALRNIACKLTNSSRAKQTPKEALNNSLLAKHLEGEKCLKTPSPVLQQKNKRVGATTPSAIRRDVKRDTTPNLRQNKSTDKGIKQQGQIPNKGKEESIKKSPSTSGSRILEQRHKSSRSHTGKELSKSTIQMQPSKTLSFSNNSFIEKVESKKNSMPQIDFPEQTVTEPCLVDKADLNQRSVTAECFMGTNTVTEGAQEVPSEPMEDIIIEKYNKQLISSIQKLSIRTFLALRSIIKPNENILACCQAFVKLFAGLNDAIPPSFAIMDNVEWENIKVLFNSPVKILKLISTLPVFIEYKKMPQRNVNAAIATLSKIPYELGDPQNEAFYQMYEFIVSAVEYYKFYKPETAGPALDIQETPTKRRTILYDSYQDSSSMSTVGLTTPAVKTQPTTTLRKDSPSIGFSTPAAKSKSPLRQSVAAKSACVSTTNKNTRASVSPLKDTLSSRKNSQTAIKKTNSQYNSAQGKSASSIKSSASLVIGGRPPTKVSLSPMRSVNTSMRNVQAQESFDSHNFTQGEYSEVDHELGNERSLIMRTDVSEMANFHDDTARQKREALSYKARASRLLADHERYIKKMMKAQEEEKEKLHREMSSVDREMLIEYIESKKQAEKSYLKEVAAEEIVARKEVKIIQAKIQERKLNDDMMETVKHSSFVATQVEKKKHEKKKELWDQYKKKMSEKLAKKQKEAEQIHAQKKEAMSNKVESIEWKKKQAAQERDKWKENYELLARLVGAEK